MQRIFSLRLNQNVLKCFDCLMQYLHSACSTI